MSRSVRRSKKEVDVWRSGRVRSGGVESGRQAAAEEEGEEVKE